MDDLLTSVKAAAAQQSTLVPLSSTPSAPATETTTRAIGIDSRVEKLHTPTLCSNNTVCYKDSECGQARLSASAIVTLALLTPSVALMQIVVDCGMPVKMAVVAAQSEAID
ncbi:unnamed protein product [Nippostrongylus brasiliensis]|uniref:Uncharacterized protein n=1 Tax=Nippostrongylus brasiliensis TaxID=27835 RepID=A0A0N4XNB9_NIPBR|nr:unnamed protein product [Nippostrongylus brasiliensis]